jgi:hypothetical protein
VGEVPQWLEQRTVHRAIIAVIVLNAVILGLETVPAVNDRYGTLLYQIDRLCLAIFVVELTLAIIAMGPARFFREPWRTFDFIVVGIALVPATGAFSVLRSLRVLRVLRLASASPRMRVVVSALLAAIPGLSSIIALLGLLFYVSAVMSTKLFGPNEVRLPADVPATQSRPATQPGRARDPMGRLFLACAPSRSGHRRKECAVGNIPCGKSRSQPEP